jgi:type IV fimbrial biogenesis protein FimT
MTQSPCAMSTKTIRPKAGFTLIELLVVLAMIGILGSLAVPSFRAIRLNSLLNETAADFSLAVQAAQGHALKTNRNVVLAPLNGSWSNGWHVFVSGDSNFTFNAGVDTVVQEREPLSGEIAVTDGLNAPATGVTAVVIEPTGFLKGVGNGRIVFGNATVGTYRHVVVAMSGRARTCRATSALPSAC